MRYWNSNLSNYYSHKTVYFFGEALITILLPVYFLLIGFSIASVISWFILSMLFSITLGISTIPFSNKFGTKKALFVGLILEAAFLVFLPFANHDIFVFIFIAFLAGLSNSFYWINDITVFTTISKKEHEGLQAGIIDSIEAAVSIAPPVIGAAILTLYGITYLSFIAALIVTLSVLPLLLLKKVRFKMRFGIRSFAESLKRYKLKKKTLFQIMNRNMQTQVIYTIWPIFLFVSGINIISIGIVGAIFALAGVVTPIIIGKFADLNHNKLMVLSTISILVVWVTLALTRNYYVLFVLSFILGVLLESFWLSIYKKILLLGKKYNVSYFSVIYTILETFFKMLVLIILLPIILLYGISTAFVAMIPITLLFLIFIKN